MDTLRHLLVTVITPPSDQDRAHFVEVTALFQRVTGRGVELAWVDQAYTGEEPAQAAVAQGIQLEVVKQPEAAGPKKGFVLLPPPLGGRAQLRLAGPLPAAGARL